MSELSHEILLSSQDSLDDYRVVKTIGLVRGNTVRSRNIVRNFIANLRTVVGGEIPEYTKVLAESREQALDRLRSHAREVGANAVLTVRIDTAEVGQNCAELLAYGTAVIIEKK